MKLDFTVPAIVQAEHIDAWWRENRSNPTVFAEDLAAVIADILSAPLIKPRFVRDGVITRRWLLTRTKHHVHYTVIESTQTVLILAVWGGPRGSAPPLPV